MKLFINGRFLSQSITGVQRYAIEMIKELDHLCTNTDDIVILCPPGEHQEISLNHIKIKIIGKRSGNIWVQFILPAYVKKHSGMLLTITGLCPILYPGYYVAHDITYIRHPESFGRKFRYFYKIINLLTLKRCNHIFTVSQFSRGELLNYYKLDKNLISVAYCSSNHLYRNHNRDIGLARWNLSGDSYYLSVSSRALHKNQKFIEQCAKRFPNEQFVVVGSNSITSFVSSNQNKLHNLNYTGYVTDEELYTLYLHSKGFIFPSFYEGFGIPPLEAILMGVKHIAVSNIDVFKEIYDRNVYFFDPYNVDSFNLQKLTNTTITEEDISYYMSRYSWANTARHIYSTIKSGE